MRRIDHIVHAVTDLDEAAAAYEEQGFVVTPRADHPFGTSNRLVLFAGAGPGSYLELVAVTRPDRIPPPGEGPSFAATVRDFVTVGPGAAMVVLGSDDPAADRADLEAADLSPYPPFSFTRDAPQPDGSTADVTFDLILLPPPGPACGVFLCHHRIPERIWHREFLDHPNGANRVAEVVVVGGPDRTYGFERLVGSPPVRRRGGLAFPLDGGILTVTDPQSFQMRFGVDPPDRPPPVIGAVVLAGTRPVAATVFGLRVVTE